MSNFLQVVDVDAATGKRGSLTVPLLGGVPTFTDYAAAYNSRSGRVYVVGYYGGPLGTLSLAQTILTCISSPGKPGTAGGWQSKA